MSTRLSNSISSKFIVYKAFELVNDSSLRRFALLMVANDLANPPRAFKLANMLKDEGVTLMVVGIGPYAEETDLRRIASSEDDLFLVDSYQSLAAVQASVLDAFCRGPFLI